MHPVRSGGLISNALAVALTVGLIVDSNAADTGIVVHAKTYDERAIQQLIAQIDTRLAQLQFIQQEGLQTATGALAGGSRRSSSTQFNISTVPTPGITTVTGPPEGGGDPVTTTTTTESSVSPAIPAPAADSLSFAAPSSYTLAARDLLSEQLELSYRVAGLRLGLERSIEDHFDVDNADQRRLALIGVDVSIDEAYLEAGAVAEVQVEIRPEQSTAGTGGTPSTTVGSAAPPKPCELVQPTLIQLLPQRESYNRVSITDKKSQIGFGLLAGIIQLGIGNRKSADNLYVVQELDTISYRFASDDNNFLRVGWRFRPALERQKVSAGLRKVFLLVSLPDEIGASDNSDQCTLPTYEVFARTLWRDWDTKNRSAGDILKARRVPLDSGWDHIRTLTYKQTDFQTAFFPFVSGIDWQELDKERISAIVSGTSFFGDLEVISGGKRLGVGSGIKLHNVERFSIELPMSALFETPPGLVIGRYGVEGSNALELNYPYHENYPPSVRAEVHAYDTKLAELVLTLRNYPNEYLADHRVPSRAIVQISSKIYGGRNRPALSRRSELAQAGCRGSASMFCNTTTTARFLVPIADLMAANGIVVVEPFFPHNHYRKFLPLSKISGLFRAEPAGNAPHEGNKACEKVVDADKGTKESICAAYAIISPDGSNDTFEAKIGKTELKTLKGYPNTATRRYVQVPKTLITKSTPITIIDGSDQWFIPLKKEPPPTKVTVSKVEEIDQNDTRWVVVSGSGLGNVKAVYLGERALPFNVSTDKKSLRVYFDSRLTKSAGVREIVLVSKDDKPTYSKVKVKKAT